MAALTLGGRTYAIAPFKLRELRLAAPHMLAVLAVGLAGVSLDELQAQASLTDLEALRQAFDRVMAEAGLKRSDGAPPREATLGDAPSGEAQGTAAPVP